MQKVHYDVPVEGPYVDGDFYGLMAHLNSSLVLNEDFPHPKNPALKGFIVNTWNLDGVTVLYRSEYKLTKDGTNTDGLHAKVILDGSEQKIGEVERKIQEGIEKGLHHAGFTTIR